MKNVVLMCFAKSGAGPAFTLAFAEGMKKSGQNVLCFITDKVSNRDDWERSSQQLDYKVLFIDTGDKKSVIYKTFGLLKNKRKYVNEVIRHFGGRVDISIETFVHPWMQLLNSWIKPKHQMAILHDPLTHSGENRLNAFLAKYQYKAAKEIIVLTKSFIPIVEEKFKKDTRDIYYMRHGKFDSYRNYKRIDGLVNYPKDKTNFLFFGRIEKYKGINELLLAYKSLKEEFPQITLTVAGNGVLDDDTLKLIEDTKCDLIQRFIDDSEVSSLFTGANLVLVLPYLDATQSGVIPIAVDFNVPVIASDSGGLREQLNDGKCGQFVLPGNVEALKECMKRFVESEDFLFEEKNKLKRFSPELSWEHISKSLVEEINRRN